MREFSPEFLRGFCKIERTFAVSSVWTPVAPEQALRALGAIDPTKSPAADAGQISRHLRQVRGWLDAYEAEWTRALNAEYEHGAGAPAADTHTRHQGCSAREARAKDRRAEALRHAHSFGEALADGRIGAEHADALAHTTAKLDESTKSDFFSHEASLLARAAGTSPEEFARHCRSLIDRINADHGIERDKRQRQNTALRRKIGTDGMYRLNGEFHPELGAAIWASIDAETNRLAAARGEQRTADRQQLAAEALGNLVSAGHERAHPKTTEVSVLIDLTTLRDGLHDRSVCEDVNGVPVPVSLIRRLCCDAHIIPVVLSGDGVTLDLGRSARLANRDQRRALRAMYRSCAFPNCDVAFSRCEIHHLLEWDQFGDTDLANLLPLCSRHHHVIHEGWSLDLATDRTLTVTRPDGRVHATARPGLQPVDTPTSGRRRRTPDTHHDRQPTHN